MDSGYSALAEFRNDTSGDTPLLAAGLFIKTHNPADCDTWTAL